MLTDMFRPIPAAVVTSGFLRMDRCISSKPSALASPRPLRFFPRVMAPVLVILLDLGAWILRYLADLLVLASSRVETMWARNKVLDLCRQCDMVIPSHSATYLGMYLESLSSIAFPSQERVSTLRLQFDIFLSCRHQNIVAWRSLLGRLSSRCFLVRRLRMRSVCNRVVIPWTPRIELVLLWWYGTDHLLQGVSVVQHPVLLLWSGASDPG